MSVDPQTGHYGYRAHTDHTPGDYHGSRFNSMKIGGLKRPICGLPCFHSCMLPYGHIELAVLLRPLMVRIVSVLKTRRRL